jgi:hypothetical protein
MLTVNIENNPALLGNTNKNPHELLDSIAARGPVLYHHQRVEVLLRAEVLLRVAVLLGM